METDYFRRGLERYKVARAKELNCEPGDFDRHELVITTFPEGTPARSLLKAWTFGLGTVVSVTPEWVEWVRERAPERHYRVLFPNVILDPLVQAAKERGIDVGYRSPNLIFTANIEPTRPVTPEGLTARVVDREWRATYCASGEFENGLGDVGDAYAEEAWRFGTALFDGETVAAVAGGYEDGPEHIEIGVDVARAYRGRGLGEAVVRAQAAEIASRGMHPTYYCSPTNVRSHRTALTCGFLPIGSAIRASVNPRS